MENADYKEVTEYIYYNPIKDQTALVDTKTGVVTYRTHTCDPVLLKDTYMCSSMGNNKDSLFWLNEHLREQGYEFIDVLEGSVIYYEDFGEC